MNKVKTIIKMMIISISLIYIPNIYAIEQPKVYINASEKDIYETGGEGSTTFDKTTNTLTLNNYNGKNISFENFEENETINIIIKGTNTIDGGESNSSGNGIGTDNQTILNITGTDESKLIVNNYYNLIYIPNGTLNINNADISIKNGTYCGIYAYEGDVNIINSKILADNIGYPIATDGGKIYLNKLEHTATNITSTDIYATESVKIENSKINVSNSRGMLYGGNETIIKDSTIDLADVAYGMNSGIIKINGGTFKAISNLTEPVSEIISAETLELNSDVTIKYKQAENILYIYDKLIINGGNIDITNEENIALNIKDLEVNGGTTNIQGKFFGINAEIPESKLIFNKGEINIKVEDGIALYTYSEEEKNVEDLIILNDTAPKDPTLNLVKSKLYGNYIYSFSKNELLPEYDNQGDLINSLTKEITITDKNVIKFDANGGTGKMKNIHFEDETILPENNFTAPQGKKFKGWSFTSNGEIINKLKVNESQTLYAIWEDEITNPKTLDNITIYIMIGFISTLGLTITQKKLKNVK